MLTIPDWDRIPMMITGTQQQKSVPTINPILIASRISSVLSEGRVDFLDDMRAEQKMDR